SMEDYIDFVLGRNQPSKQDGTGGQGKAGPKKSSIAAGSGVKPTEWYADLNRIPKDLEDGTQRDPQIFMLAETGRRIQALSEGIPYVRKQSKEVHKLLLAPGADVAAVGELGGLSWIHYLIYTLGEPVCVPAVATTRPSPGERLP
ncbi:MAG: hypothetical protein EOP21_08905, partial [Hyphomicrobiales bacterium]